MRSSECRNKYQNSCFLKPPVCACLRSIAVQPLSLLEHLLFVSAPWEPLLIGSAVRSTWPFRLQDCLWQLPGRVRFQAVPDVSVNSCPRPGILPASKKPWFCRCVVVGNILGPVWAPRVHLTAGYWWLLGYFNGQG